jgi:hypothetical protein
LLPILKTAESIVTHLPLNVPLLPWASSAQWKEAHQSLSYHLSRRPNAWNKALAVTDRLDAQLKMIFPIIDELCIHTCPRCPEPCCLTAKVWFDFKDLLFLHLSRKPVPLTPPLVAIEDTCRYAGHRGCMLPRSSRPWICTWYLCPAQTANLKQSKAGQRTFISRVLGEIKALRKKLEDEFIRVII